MTSVDGISKVRRRKLAATGKKSSQTRLVARKSRKRKVSAARPVKNQPFKQQVASSAPKSGRWSQSNKQLIALVFFIVVISGVFILWGYSIKKNLQQIKGASANRDNTEFAQTKDDFQEVVGDIGGSLANIKKFFSTGIPLVNDNINSNQNINISSNVNSQTNNTNINSNTNTVSNSNLSNPDREALEQVLVDQLLKSFNANAGLANTNAANNINSNNVNANFSANNNTNSSNVNF